MSLFREDFTGGWSNWKAGFPWEPTSVVKPTFIEAVPSGALQPFTTGANGLTILAAKSPPGSLKPWYTGLLASRFTRLFGYFEFVAQMPVSPGAVNGALWLYPTGASGNAEIDVVEHKGSWLMQTVWDGSAHNPTYGANMELTRWRTYAVDWQPDFITFYVDDVRTFQTPTPANSKTVPMMIALSVNIDDPLADNTVMPASMNVRSVEVWLNRADRVASSVAPAPTPAPVGGVTAAQITAIVQAQITAQADLNKAIASSNKVTTLLNALKP